MKQGHHQVNTYRILGQHKRSRVAQVVEQAPEEGRVAGSTPALGTLGMDKSRVDRDG